MLSSSRHLLRGPGGRHLRLRSASPFSASFSTVAWDGRVSGLDDGSESTLGQDGRYEGSWDAAAARPHGQGTMVG